MWVDVQQNLRDRFSIEMVTEFEIELSDHRRF